LPPRARGKRRSYKNSGRNEPGEQGFEQALAITEELTALGTAKIKSLHFLLSAEGFFDGKARVRVTSAQVSFARWKIIAEEAAILTYLRSLSF